MPKPTIAIMAAGEMGAGIAAALHHDGYTINTILHGRSPETLTRAANANMKNRANMSELLADCQIFMSIVPPALAKTLAKQVAEQAKINGRSFTYVDCNAISPDHTKEIAALFENTAVKFVDAGIIGGPPNLTTSYKPVLYTSGTTCLALNDTIGTAYNIQNLGNGIGRASGMKMVYASITKGTNALLTAAFMTAQNLNLLDELTDELKASQTEMYNRAINNIQRLPADAGRWAPEMAEIAKTFKSAGAPDGFHIGAEQMMQILDNSPYGTETRQTRDTNRTAAQTIKSLKPL